MERFSFTHLKDENIKIQGITSLFKQKNGSRWAVNLVYSPKQTKQSISMSNAPILSRQRLLNPTEHQKPVGIPLSFSISNTQEWSIAKIADCSALKHLKFIPDQEQLCFVITLKDDLKVYIPQFELARVLFFHDNYLSRASLEPGRLEEEFDIQKNGDSAQINVMPSAEYKVTHFNDQVNRRFLSWVLLDSEARASFESIGKSQLENGYEPKGGNYRFWDFSFTPPPLKNVELIVRGWKENNSKSMFVYEISSVQNLPVNMPTEVNFYHPDFKIPVQGKANGGKGGQTGQLLEYELHDGEYSDPDKAHMVVRMATTTISFAKAIKTNRVADKTQVKRRGSKVDDLSDVSSVKATTNEENDSGVLPGADWNTVDDITDDAHLYKNKFSCFFNMLEYLRSMHGCAIKEYPLRKLPWLARCTKHMLADDANPRCIALIELIYSDQIFHILEVDTSDAEKSLSTMLLKLKNPSNIQNDITDIEIQLIKGSLRWPTKLLGGLYGKENYLGVSHPQSKHQGVLDPEDIEYWADRFFSKVKDF